MSCAFIIVRSRRLVASDGHRVDGRSCRQKNADALKPYYLAALAPAVTQANAPSARRRCNIILGKRAIPSRKPAMEELPHCSSALLARAGTLRRAEDRRQSLVSRTTPAALPPFPAGAPRNRLGLGAMAYGPASSSLTARVAVKPLSANVFWSRNCFNHGKLWRSGSSAHTSGTARLACAGFHQFGLGHQSHTEENGSQCHSIARTRGSGLICSNTIRKI